MSELSPCPECRRHVRKTETRCPFCGEAVSLAHLPSPALPRRRLGRAATFAFGATVVGATALSGCDDTATVAPPYGIPPSGGSSFAGSNVYGAPPSGSSTGGNGGADDAGTAVYGAPAAGMGNEDSGGNGGAAPGGAGATGADAGAGGAAGDPFTEGGATPLYGGPPGGVGGI